MVDFKHPGAGFTLVEVLVSLGLLALLSLLMLQATQVAGGMTRRLAENARNDAVFAVRDHLQRTIQVFQFMSAHQAVFPIAAMARVLGVSRTGDYALLDREPSARAQADQALLKRIQTVHAVSRGTYGAPRIHAELKAEDQAVSRKRIARLMREAALARVSRRRGPVTTRRDREARPAPDLVDRNVTADAPNRLWVADITFVPTLAGFLSLAVVLDAWSRRIVGWAMANHLRTELVLDAFEMALGQRRPTDVVHHFDQGSQDTSLAFGGRCREAGVRPSMGSVGNPYDCEKVCAVRGI